MVERCASPKSDGWKNYGARGITVCDRWLRFDNFLQDMGVPAEGCSLDRKDNDGPYAPWNCRWATAKEQRANQRDRQEGKGAARKRIKQEAKMIALDELRNGLDFL
jgi:hypothetical protein